jgi:hypothetical protein
MSRLLAVSVVSLSSVLFACGPTTSGSDDLGVSDVEADAVLLDAVAADPGVETGDRCDALEMSMGCGAGTAAEVRFCASIGGDLEWGPCIPAASLDCALGADEGTCETCELYGGVPSWNYDACGGDTPLVLRFGDTPITFTTMGAVGFDINGVGECDAYDFPVSRDTPWLALDRDGNGTIEDGAELFGSGTVLADGRRADNGFTALAELDDNGDGRIDASDSRFGELLTWSDHDENRVGAGLELQRVDAAGLVAIDLEYRVDPLCDARGNCGVERAAFTWTDRRGVTSTGEVVDVHLPCR